MRSAASGTQPLQERVVPRAALTRWAMRAFYTGWWSIARAEAIFRRMDDWERNLIEDDEERLMELLRSARRVAVLGIKTEIARGQPAFYVPQALQQMGLSIVPVPVYYPDAQEILGEKVYRRGPGGPGEVHNRDPFPRSGDVGRHPPALFGEKTRGGGGTSGEPAPPTAR